MKLPHSFCSYIYNIVKLFNFVSTLYNRVEANLNVFLIAFIGMKFSECYS